MGDSKAPDTQRLQDGYNMGYQAAGEGKDVSAMLAGQQSDLVNSMLLGASDYRPVSEPAFELPEFNFPEMPDYTEQYEQQKIDAARVAGEANVNALYSAKFAAANSATDRVNSQIEEEASYAKAGGAEYVVNEDQKRERINNMFGTLWSSEQESKLASLESEWGAGENRWTSGIVRGEGTDVEGVLGKDETSAGRPVVDPLDEEEDDDELLGGGAFTLGG